MSRMDYVNWQKASNDLESMAYDRGPSRLRYVPCEHCHGTGEIIYRDGEYRSGWPEPNEYAVLCSACEGYGMECVETDDAGIEHTETKAP